MLQINTNKIKNKFNASLSLSLSLSRNDIRLACWNKALVMAEVVVPICLVFKSKTI